ncbi:hypothetical protein CYLTODRAFT_340262 [Cylindrobasidium torrendii FP15055 ss-10]|uniref:Pentatricopeptide repeat-containing protein-mitochondrial domain-containing protein n=1 Tax=Cylindrobasidium torrendii FP15055 ss-10 TaxID=1314674 RepID=A0A0D7BXJ4_9AGAR|nr:hypothetical protein CYLTODRAFT_340262 [Cylindrobasidium torrendii FP15055 ss-10]
MKQSGGRPNVETFNLLIRAAALSYGSLECFAILEDMLAVGVKPDVLTFNGILSSCENSKQMFRILEDMKVHNVEPNNESYEHLFRLINSSTSDRTEFALHIMMEMRAKGLEPTLASMEILIEMMVRFGHVHIAYDLIKAFEQDSARMLGLGSWMTCLQGASQVFWVEGVEDCWNHIMSHGSMLPDEGTCMNVLNTAGRFAKPELAASVVEVFRARGVHLQDFHFIPLVEALIESGSIREALQFLPTIRRLGVNTDASSVTQPIVKYLSQNSETLDSIWDHLDAIRDSKELVDAAALNAVVEAAVKLNDLQRAMGAYKSFEDYFATPTIETFHHLFEACTTARHRELGNVLLNNLKELGLPIDAKLFEQMIHLCLIQQQYDDAFFYLEEMKAAGYVPSRRIYVALARKCMHNADGRSGLVLEEMAEAGYPPLTEGPLKRDGVQHKVES